MKHLTNELSFMPTQVKIIQINKISITSQYKNAFISVLSSIKNYMLNFQGRISTYESL